MACLINGKPASDELIATDRGLHYGDGCFRTLAIFEGEALDLKGQLAHLGKDAQSMDIHAPLAELEAEACQLAAGQDSATLKIILTRGAGPRGYRHPDKPSPHRYLFTSEAPAGLAKGQAQGIRVRRCSTRMGLNPALAGLKHLNRLEQVLARNEWADPAIAEGLMFDVKGQLISGVQSNVFVVRNGVLHTPDLKACGVAGRMRARILALAKDHGMHYKQSPLTTDALNTADEVFISNSLIGIWPVVHCDDITWSIGDVTRRLQSLLDHPALS